MSLIVMLLGFIAAPLIVICGLTMFRSPEAWARMNAHLARKDLSQFNSPKQLERTRKVGKLFLAVGAFELMSMTWLLIMLRTMK
jgi:hypothetical protein